MKTIRTLPVAAAVAIGFAAPAKQAAAQCLAPGFEGTWHGDDGGTYRIIYLSGSRVRWDGRSGDNGRSWVNRFFGTREGDVLTGEWNDLGRPHGHGTLTIRMENDHHLVRTASTGSYFGGTSWTRPVPSHGCDDNQGGPVDD